jgi:AcrR family transcriptional regulator
MPSKRARTPRPSAATAGKVPEVENTRDHILDRTIYLIGKKGTTDVPVREIAREAGVNVAAINYYFSSKEQMYEQMVARFLTGYRQVMDQLKNPDVPPEKRLRHWCGEVMRYLTDYPGILALMAREMTTEPGDVFGRMLRKVITDAYHAVGETLREMVGKRLDPDAVAFKLTMLVSTLAGPLPVQGDGQAIPEGLRGPDLRERFLDLLLEHLHR